MWEYSAEQTKYENSDLCWGRSPGVGSRDQGPKLSWQPPVRFNNPSQYNLNISAGRLTGNNWLTSLLLTFISVKYLFQLLVGLSSMMTTWYNLSFLHLAQSAGANFIKTSLSTCPHCTEWLFSLECSAGNGRGGFYWEDGGYCSSAGPGQ